MQLILGTAQLLGGYGAVRRDRSSGAAAAAHLLRAAALLKVSAVDTAPSYEGVEDAIGAAAMNLEVHTKIDPRLSAAESLAGSLARLRRAQVQVLYVHDSAEVLRRGGRVISEAYELVGERIDRLGASIYDVDEFDAAVADPRISAVQAPVNVFDRRLGKERLEAAAAAGTRVYARSVLLQGVLVAAPTSLEGAVRPLSRYVTAFRTVADACGRPPVELALGWIRSVPGIYAVVVGAETPHQLRALDSAFRSPPLGPGELRRLEDLDLPAPEMCDPRRW